INSLDLLAIRKSIDKANNFSCRQMYGRNIGRYWILILLGGPDWFAAVYIFFRSTDTLSVA
ncbi:MAG: hypothetical protein AB8B70_11250, partial [Prochlorococcus sp.]